MQVLNQMEFLKFQPLDAEHGIMATAFFGGVASLSFAYAHLPEPSLFHRSSNETSVVPGLFAKAAPMASGPFGQSMVLPVAGAAPRLVNAPHQGAGVALDSGIARRTGHIRLPLQAADPKPISPAGFVRTDGPISKPGGPDDNYSYVVRVDLPSALPVAEGIHAAPIASVPLSKVLRLPIANPIAPAGADFASPSPLSANSRPSGVRSALPVADAIASPPSEAPSESIATIPAETSRLTIPADQTAPGLAKSPLPLMALPDDVARFDLASIRRPVTPTAASPQKSRLVSVAQTTTMRATAVGSAKPRVRDRVENGFIIHQTAVSLDNQITGNIPVRISSSGELSVQVGRLLALVGPNIEPAVYGRLAGASAAQEYISFAGLRDRGIDLRYDAGNDSLKVQLID